MLGVRSYLHLSRYSNSYCIQYGTVCINIVYKSTLTHDIAVCCVFSYFSSTSLLLAILYLYIYCAIFGAVRRCLCAKTSSTEYREKNNRREERSKGQYNKKKSITSCQHSHTHQAVIYIYILDDDKDKGQQYSFIHCE